MATRVAFVGAGSISAIHFDSMDELGDAVDVVGVADPSEEARLKAAARFKCPTFEDSASMFDDVAPEAIFVLVPPFARGEPEIDAINRGMHVFVEKPVALNMKTALEISAAIDAANVVSSVGYQWRYSNLMRHAEQFASQTATALASGYWAGAFPQRDWWGQLEKSGGQIVEQSTHIFDMCRYFLGEPLNVFARSSRRSESPPEGSDVPDAGIAVVEFESGAIAQITSTCLLPENYRVEISLMSESGVVQLGSSELKIFEPNQLTTFSDPGHPHLEEARAFIKAVQVGDASNVLSPFADAVKTLELTLAAVESARMNAVVELQESLI